MYFSLVHAFSGTRPFRTFANFGYEVLPPILVDIDKSHLTMTQYAEGGWLTVCTGRVAIQGPVFHLALRHTDRILLMPD